MTKKLLLNEKARQWLKSEGACSKCFPWACQNGQTLSELITKARPDWALWVFLRPGVLTERERWLAACAFAEHVLPVWHKQFPDDHRPKQAIEARRGWLDGKVSDDELREAWEAAWAADAAAWAWRDAALAADAALEAAWASRDAAWEAAWASRDAALAADAARDASWDAALAAEAAWEAAWASRDAALAADDSEAERRWQVDWILANCKPVFVDVDLKEVGG